MRIEKTLTLIDDQTYFSSDFYLCLCKASLEAQVGRKLPDRIRLTFSDSPFPGCSIAEIDSRGHVTNVHYDTHKLSCYITLRTRVTITCTLKGLEPTDNINAHKPFHGTLYYRIED